MSRPGVAKVRALAALAAVSLLAACASGDEVASESTDTVPSTTAAEPEPDGDPADAADEGCGVTLAEVQVLLEAGSGVTQNDTPDPRRCNFTWDDGGPRGIDVAIVRGGRSSFEAPAGFEPIEGYGDEAFASTDDGRASALAFLGKDLVAADVVAEGTDATEADLRDLCLQLLELALD